MQVCTRCVMDNRSDSTITFAKDGTCNYCNDALKRMEIEYHPNSAGKKYLDSIMTKIKKEGEGKQYDCMVGVSGGVDSSYIIYLGYKYGLRVLAAHIDDELDTEIAVNNIRKLCKTTKTDIIMVKPPSLDEYKDLIRSFFFARVPNLAMPQDNFLDAALIDVAKKNGLKYVLSGANFALECILERSTGINAFDKKHILAIHKQFGRRNIDGFPLTNFYRVYIHNRYFNKTVKVFPLNFIDYNLNIALDELAGFCAYEYYGGKHHESILTRFLQCYYLPVKYGFDKRKSHFSSMIISGQMTRLEALERLSEDPYLKKEIKEYDLNYIADYLGMTRGEFNDLISLPPKYHRDYPASAVNNYEGLARKFRKYLGK